MPSLFGAPEVAASGDGRLELFVFDGEGSLWHIYQTLWSGSDSWSDWCAAGESGDWPATVAANGDGTLTVIVVTGEQQLASSSQTSWSNGWSDWSALPAVPPELGFYPPGVAANADGRLELFVANGALWSTVQTSWSNGWNDWQQTAGPGALVTGPVAAGRSGDGRIEVFVLDTEGRLWNVHQTSPGSGFTGWNAFGNAGVALDDRPGLARSADGRLELFVRGTDNRLYHQWETAVGTGVWSGWVQMDLYASTPAGGFVDHPVVAASADGRLELFLTGADGNVYHTWQIVASGDWSAPWTSEGSAGGGFGPAAPGLGRNGDGRLQLFAVGRDGNLYYKYQTVASNGWTSWSLLGGQSGPTTTVPYVVGLNAAAAIQRIEDAHLVPDFSNEPPYPSEIRSQSPLAGAVVPYETIVQVQWLKQGQQPP